MIAATRVPSRLDEVMTRGVRGGGSARVHPQFAQDALDMGGDGTDGQSSMLPQSPGLSGPPRANAARHARAGSARPPPRQVRRARQARRQAPDPAQPLGPPVIGQGSRQDQSARQARTAAERRAARCRRARPAVVAPRSPPESPRQRPATARRPGAGRARRRGWRWPRALRPCRDGRPIVDGRRALRCGERRPPPDPRPAWHVVPAHTARTRSPAGYRSPGTRQGSRQAAPGRGESLPAPTRRRQDS